MQVKYKKNTHNNTREKKTRKRKSGFHQNWGVKGLLGVSLRVLGNVRVTSLNRVQCLLVGHITGKHPRGLGWEITSAACQKSYPKILVRSTRGGSTLKGRRTCASLARRSKTTEIGKKKGRRGGDGCSRGLHFRGRGCYTSFGGTGGLVHSGLRLITGGGGQPERQPRVLWMRHLDYGKSPPGTRRLGLVDARGISLKLRPLNGKIQTGLERI